MEPAWPRRRSLRRRWWPAQPVAPTLVLDRDGLGVASFGDVADDTIAAVTAVLGEPDKDSGWVEPLTIGACAGAEARFVAWGSLYLYFSDESGVGHGERHFFSYSYGSERDLEAIPEGLATPEGIGLGTSVAFYVPPTATSSSRPAKKACSRPTSTSTTTSVAASPALTTTSSP